MQKYQNDMNIFQDIEFKSIKSCCDSLFTQPHTKGIGADQKEILALSSNKEDKLWEKEVIGIDSFILVIYLIVHHLHAL